MEAWGIHKVTGMSHHHHGSKSFETRLGVCALALCMPKVIITQVVLVNRANPARFILIYKSFTGDY